MDLYRQYLAALHVFFHRPHRARIKISVEVLEPPAVQDEELQDAA